MVGSRLFFYSSNIPTSRIHFCWPQRHVSLYPRTCRLLSHRLRWYFEVKKLLNPNQYRFRRYRSTIDILTNLETNICDAFLNVEYIAAFDIEKAFDIIWKSKIANSPIQLKVNDNMLSFITNFLSNRSIQVKVNGTLLHPVIIKNGVLQGSVMSTTLFLIGINDITINLKPPIKTQLFANDITITCSGKNVHSINQHLQTTINTLHDR